METGYLGEGKGAILEYDTKINCHVKSYQQVVLFLIYTVLFEVDAEFMKYFVRRPLVFMSR